MVHTGSLLIVLSPLSSNRYTKFALYAVLVSFVSVEQSVKCSLCDDVDPGSILARKEFFLNNTFNFHRVYTLPGFINFNLQRGKTYTWVGSTWDSNIYIYIYIYIYYKREND